MYPLVSPGKTVEGLLGGLTASVGVAFLSQWVYAIDLAVWHVAAVGVLAGVFGVLGDLSESLLKRSVDAKDSKPLERAQRIKALIVTPTNSKIVDDPKLFKVDLNEMVVREEASKGKLAFRLLDGVGKIDSKGMGPAVLKMNPDAAVLKSAISDGRKSMPAFAEKLDEEKINALVAFIQSKHPALNPCAKNLSGK